MASGFISGIISGTSGSILKADELSITTAPDLAATGANSFEMLPPALKRAMSTSLNEFDVNYLTGIALPWKGNTFPTDLADANSVSFLTGKSLFSKHWIISCPTAPVIPTIATCGSDINLITFESFLAR